MTSKRASQVVLSVYDIPIDVDPPSQPNTTNTYNLSPTSTYPSFATSPQSPQFATSPHTPVFTSPHFASTPQSPTLATSPQSPIFLTPPQSPTFNTFNINPVFGTSLFNNTTTSSTLPNVNSNNSLNNESNANSLLDSSNADKPLVLPRLSWTLIIRVLEAKNLYITKKKYHPRVAVKFENSLNGKTKECKTELSHPVWNHSFERVSTTNPYATFEFEIIGSGTIFNEKIGSCKLDLTTVAYGKTEKNWIPILPPGVEKMSPAEAAESVRGELLVEIERSVSIRENFVFTFQWDEDHQNCTIYNHFDTPIFTVGENYRMLNIANNSAVFTAVVKSKNIQPKSHTLEFGILQNGAEIYALETNINKTIKYHAGGPESSSHWQHITTMGCKKYTIDFSTKKRYCTVFTNNDTQQQDATYTHAKNHIEILPNADVLQILFLTALSDLVPYPEKPSRM